MDGPVFSAAAILITASAAALLKRSPERYLGNVGLIALAAGIAGIAVFSLHVAAHRYRRAPARTFVTDNADGLVADGDRVALLLEHEIRFVDFSQPAPQATATVPMPLWSFDSDWSSGGRQASMADGTVFLTGRKKAVPVDEREVAIVSASAPVQEIPLGPVGRGDFVSQPVPVGTLLYLGTTRERQCALHVFDPASRREVTSIPIDQLRPAIKDVDEGEPPLSLTLRGGYLYVATAVNLTTVDVGDAAHPRIVSRLPFHPKATSLYGFPRQFSWQDNRLYEVAFWPYGLAAYDLSDPARPSAQSELIWHSGFSLAGSGRALYMPWQEGLLEYRAEAGELRGQRYLSDGRPLSSLAVGNNYLFGLTGADENNHRTVEAFRLSQSHKDN